MPNFDTGVQGFSFARIFSENKYSGSDRINDANRVTMALSSRLIDENTGVERFRVAVAKQVHLTKPQGWGGVKSKKKFGYCSFI